MRNMLIIVCCMLATQTIAWAETWEDRAAKKSVWSSDFPDDPACWNTSVGWNTGNPWVVGKGDHEAYYALANCFRACAENDTCYKDGWQDTDVGSASCRVRGAPRPETSYYWWETVIALNEIEFPMVGFSPGKLHSIAWCE